MGSRGTTAANGARLVAGVVSAMDASSARVKPVQNAFAESFIGRLRDELLNETLFRSLPHARAVLEAWRADYNTERPHTRLGWMTPATYHRPPGHHRPLDSNSDWNGAASSVLTL